MDCAIEKLRKLIERCDYFSGFMISYGIGGGTGSGMGSLIMSKVTEEYPDKLITSNVLCPHNKM